MLRVALISIGILAFAAVSRSDDAADWAAALPTMVGKSSQELLEDHSDLLIGDDERPQLLRPSPWHVWHFVGGDGEERFLVFAAQRIFLIPGISSASVRLFAADGEEKGSWHFSTGWRIDIESAEMSLYQDPQAPAIVVKSSPVINGRDVAKQIYAFDGDSLWLVRIEDSNGKLIRNDYLSPNLTLGVAVGGRSKDEWVADLESESLVRRLSALTYIAGVHMNPDNPREGVRSESIDDAKTAKSVGSDAAVDEAIARYRESDSTWLRQAAELATSWRTGRR